MAGNVTGGKKAAAKNLANDPDFYRKIGAKGGSARFVAKGFAANVACYCKVVRGQHYISKCAGRKGGRASRRGPKRETI